MAEHLSDSEIEKEAKKLKRFLESWREVILPINSILLWEKNSYLGIIIGTTTVLFFFLWLLDPSVLSILSVLGIIVALADYLVPKLTVHFCHPEKWTSAKERKLESICKTLAEKKINIVNSANSFYQLRTDHPKRYFFIVTANLIVLFWIGNSVNNLFVTYVIVTALLLLPGIQQRGIINKYTDYVYNMVKDKVRSGENLKSD